MKKIIKKEFIHDQFEKLYPIEYNCEPLNYNIDNTFSYDYNENNFILFNSLNSIPISYLKKIYFIKYIYKNNIKRFIDNLQNNNIIEKEYNHSNIKNKSNNTKKNNKNININNINKLTFEELIEKK